VRVALLREVFHDPAGAERLERRLVEAAARGATLAVLPELALDAWFPAARGLRPGDAEAPEGPRHSVLSRAAARSRMALVGGAVVVDAGTGRRHNTALVFAADGSLAGCHRKLHLPSEPGFWEADHYAPGDEPPAVIAGAWDVPLGIQLCSDINRPAGAQVLAARGAVVILVPRATEAATWRRWRLVLKSAALTGAAYVLSVGRPDPEPGARLGGPSFAADPDGETIVESEERIVIVRIDPAAVEAARKGYPGSLAARPEVYQRAYADLASAGGGAAA
jgi:N-carbamoylputrescine amidase